MRQKFDSLSENLNNSTSYLTLLLDPRYKAQIIPNNLDVDMAKKELLDVFTGYQILENQNKESNEETNTTPIGEKRKSLGIMEQILQKKMKSNNSQSYNEVDEYLAIPVEPQYVNLCEW